MELVKVRTCRGGYVHVAKHELEGTRTLLRLFKANGERVSREFSSIHRGNLDPTGEVTRQNQRGASILGADWTGYGSPAQVKREITRLKQKISDYEIKEVDGVWIGIFRGDAFQETGAGA